MKPRQRDTLILLRCIEFYRIVWSKMERRNSISPEDVPQEDAPDSNFSSHLNDNTITSTSPAEVYDYAIKFPPLPSSASCRSEPTFQLHTCVTLPNFQPQCAHVHEASSALLD